MSQPLKIDFKILSYWRCGTGAGRGSELDAACARDADGLPYIPGRQVRGLLRDAVRRLAALSRREDGFVEALFGATGPAAAIGEGDGRLEIESARIPDPDRALFAGDAATRRMLFTALSSTRIDERGVAAERTLRREEVALPMRLEATIEALPNAPPDWRETLIEAAALIEGVGARRTRGLGRAIVTCGEGETDDRA